MKRTLIAMAAILTALGSSALLAVPTVAQSLSTTTIGLYPPQAGELAFAELRALRQSPHYAQLRTTLVPERLRQLEGFALSLGIDLETQAQQMSWALVPSSEGGGEELLTVIEGAFSPATALERARAAKIPFAQASGQSVITAGKNDHGQEFVFSLPDSATLVFGSRTAVEALLARRAEGRGGLSDDSTLTPLISERNGHSPVWAVLDQRYTELALRQMAPGVADQPQAATLLQGVISSTVDLTLARDFAGHATLHCRGAQEAQLLAAIVQAGFSLAAAQASEKNPDFAAALRTATVELQGTSAEAKLNLPDAQISALLQKTALHF